MQAESGAVPPPDQADAAAQAALRNHIRFLWEPGLGPSDWSRFRGGQRSAFAHPTQTPGQN